jgi:hypothetical protein
MDSKPVQKTAKDFKNFSSFIHPRNPYAKYDYESIAKEFLEFKSYLSNGPSGKVFLDWTDRDAVRCLMRCCLKRDFKLDLVRFKMLSDFVGS